MELENLRDSWRSSNAGAQDPDRRSETEWEKVSARVAAGKFQSSMQRLRRRWRWAIIPIVLLPAIWMGPLQQGGLRLTLGCWIVLCLFVASALTHLLYFLRLLDRCDPVSCTVREISEAVVRLRRSFLRSEVIHLPMAALLLVLFYQQQQETPFHEAWIYGFWLGLAIGLPIGISLFLRILDDINVLAKAVKELDE